jgi:hypothetical protein
MAIPRWISAVTVGLLALSATGAQAQMSFPYAIVADDALLLVNAAGASREVARAAAFSSLVWNADGSQLAFLAFDDDFNTRINVADAASGEVVVLDTPPLVAGYPINWTADGLILFMGEQDSVDIGADQTIPVDIMTIAPVAGAAPEVIRSVRVGVGCGGGSPFPDDQMYTRETGGLGGFFLTLAPTPTGILFSADCGGSTLGLIDLASGEVFTEQGITRVVVHPSGMMAAGIEVGQFDVAGLGILIIDLARLETVSYSTSAEPHQLAWSADGTRLYYSTRTVSGDALAQFTDADREALNTALGFEIVSVPTYDMSIYSLDLATGADAEIASWEGIVARMAEVNGRLYYSLIPNGHVRWIQDIRQGRTTFDAPDAARYFTPMIVEFDFAGSQMQRSEGSLFTPMSQR